MYQEETYEDDGSAQEAMQIANEQARFEYEADEAHETLWAGTDYRDLAIGMARELTDQLKQEVA